MSDNGWIKLHRNLINWEWYDDNNTKILFIHMLMKANHKPAKWRGFKIDRGQFITSLTKLSLETGLTVSQVRTALRKLTMTGEIAGSSQARHRVITIVEYNQYQEDDRIIAGSSQDDRRMIATNKNEKNEKNEKNLKIKKINKKENSALPPVDFSKLKMVANDSTIEEIKRIRKKNKGGSITQRVADALAMEFKQAISNGYFMDDLLTEWEVRGWRSFKADWMPIKQNNVFDLSKQIYREGSF